MIGISIRRKREWMGLIRTLDVYVDDVRVGDLKAGETRLFETQAGAHRLRVQMDWCRSPDFGIHVSASETPPLEASCRFGGLLNICDLPGIVLWPKRLFVIDSVRQAQKDAI